MNPDTWVFLSEKADGVDFLINPQSIQAIRLFRENRSAEIRTGDLPYVIEGAAYETLLVYLRAAGIEIPGGL